MAVLDPNEIMFTAFEPKVQNRFILYVDGIPAYLIKKASAKNISCDLLKIAYTNLSINTQS